MSSEDFVFGYVFILEFSRNLNLHKLNIKSIL